MANRNSVLKFKRPRTIKEVEDLWFVSFLVKEGEFYHCGLMYPYFHKDDSLEDGGEHMIVGFNKRHLIKQLDDVIIKEEEDQELHQRYLKAAWGNLIKKIYQGLIKQ